MQRTAVSQVDYGRKLRIGGMSCLSSKFLQRFLLLVRCCSAYLLSLPRSLLCPQLPSRWRRRVSWSKCDGTAAGAGGTAGAAGMVDAIAAIPTVVGAART